MLEVWEEKTLREQAQINFTLFYGETSEQKCALS